MECFHHIIISGEFQLFLNYFWIFYFLNMNLSFLFVVIAHKLWFYLR